MPYIPGTPEALLPRSDSKNPNATCRGLTNSGRPCRRAINGSPRSSKSRTLSSYPGQTASPQEGSPDGYCWQHKDQAQLIAAGAAQGLQNITTGERTSVDTLIDRLGLLELEQRKPKQSRPGHTSTWEHPPQRRPDPPRPKPRSKQKSNLGLFCCIGEVDNVQVAPRPVRKVHREKLSPSLRPRLNVLSPTLSPRRQSPRPSLAHSSSSRTAEFLSLIPHSATPETTALLLSELSKPLSIYDEDGYIYIFWLTSTDIPLIPPSEAASSLLEVSIGRGRSTSEVLKTFSDKTTSGKKETTILLKIGRASNVQRRLNEWSRQCGYNLSLIRYYPYQSSSPGAEEPPRTPRKVPFAHKVERLIHIELQGKKVGSGKCDACGREHREWFEVEAKRESVKSVDEVVRRWVDWAMKGGLRQLV